MNSYYNYNPNFQNTQSPKTYNNNILIKKKTYNNNTLQKKKKTYNKYTFDQKENI